MIQEKHLLEIISKIRILRGRFQKTKLVKIHSLSQSVEILSIISNQITHIALIATVQKFLLKLNKKKHNA